MVWERLREAMEDPPPPEPTVRDVFRTFANLSAAHVPVPMTVSPAAVFATYSEKLRSREFLQKTERAAGLSTAEMRVGWLWFQGGIGHDENTKKSEAHTRILMPAVSAPINVDLGVLTYLGDPQVSPLITDVATRLNLLERLFDELHWDSDAPASDTAVWIRATRALVRKLERREFLKDRITELGGGPLQERPAHEVAEVTDETLAEWIYDFARAIDVSVNEIRNDGLNAAPPGKINVLTGFAAYESTSVSPRRGVYDLTDLDRMPSVRGTAFGTLYGTPEVIDASERSDEAMAFRPMSARQKIVANRLNENRISVLSGAPGTGKTHLLSVTAANAIAAGESVLVLAGSQKAVDVLVDHFANTPGPPPVTFGGSRFGGRVSAELINLSNLVSDAKDVSPELLDQAHEHDRRAAVVRLFLESIALRRAFATNPIARSTAEAELKRVGGADEVAELIDSLDSPGLWPREGKLRKLLGTIDGAHERLAELRQMEAALADPERESFTIDRELDDLSQHETQAAMVGGDLLTAHWIDTLNRSEKRVLREVGLAIRANRVQRRQRLAELNSDQLTKAAPLWIGSLADVDDMLPSVIGLFDVVIIDEASQVDQVAAANALVRGKRAVIAGDPQQLGFARYLTNEEVDRAKAVSNTTSLPIDPTSLSLFDAAAAKFPVEVLDEHFRSAPHVIEFSSRRFYDGGLFTSTRHPSNEDADHIDVSVVEGVRNESGVNEAELAECVRILEAQLGNWSSIGIITASRAQVDAVEEALLARHQLQSLRSYGVRVGTAWDFQGDEVEFLIVSFGVGGNEPDSAWDVVNDPLAFNVMVTRARERVHIVTSNPTPPGLAGEYVKWEVPLVDLVRDEGSADPWVLRVADTLRAAGIPVRTGYRVGRYVVDLVAGEGKHAVAIDCTLHADGVDAHIDRALMLRRTGWRTADCFVEKWEFLLDEYPEFLTQKFPELNR